MELHLINLRVVTVKRELRVVSCWIRWTCRSRSMESFRIFFFPAVRCAPPHTEQRHQQPWYSIAHDNGPDVGASPRQAQLHCGKGGVLCGALHTERETARRLEQSTYLCKGERTVVFGGYRGTLGWPFVYWMCALPTAAIMVLLNLQNRSTDTWLWTSSTHVPSDLSIKLFVSQRKEELDKAVSVLVKWNGTA